MASILSLKNLIKERTAHVRVFTVVSSAVLKRACDHIGDKTRGLIIIFFITDVDTIYDDVHYVFSKVFYKEFDLKTQ